jgi:hypothetical protein
MRGGIALEFVEGGAVEGMRKFYVEHVRSGDYLY